MSEPESSPQLHPFSAGALSFLRTLLVALVGGFFTPTALLRRSAIRANLRNDFLRHLRPIELLLRRILMVEALRIAPSLAPPNKKRGRPEAPLGQPQPPLDASDSSSWQATFCLIPSREDPGARRLKALLARPDSLTERADPPRHRLSQDSYSTQTLAMRLEALIRVAANPANCIRRLARRFANGAPRRIEALVADRFTPWDQFNAHLHALKVEATRLLEPFADSS